MNNRLYRVIFNKRRGQMVAVAENARREGKGEGEGLGAAVEAPPFWAALRGLPFSVMLAFGGALCPCLIALAHMLREAGVELP